jgi:carotenoid cleavage dioxygenase-like enzyme
VDWFELENCYVFHGMNAYDDNGRIVLDVVRHPRMFASHLPGPNEGPATLDRWTIDLTAGKVLEERLDDRAQEFPPRRRAADRPASPVWLQRRRQAPRRRQHPLQARLHHPA